MKRSVLLAAALVLAVSCTPEIYTHYLEVRQPSDSGLDLSRKSMAVVYMDGKAPADSAFNRSVASAMARALEEDYFGGEEVIGLYRIPQADSLSKEMMQNLVMDTGEDVIFLVNSTLGEAALETNQVVHNARSVDSAYVCPAQIPLSTTLFIYDSMGEDVVHRYNGSAVIRPLVFNNGTMPEENLKRQALLASAGAEAETIGNRISNRFISNWQVEGFSFYYYDDSTVEQWISAIEKAVEGKFSAAVNDWTKFLDTDDERRKACACYNIALAFYLMDDMSLATRWLDQADALDSEVVLSPGLRRRIAAKAK